MIRSEQLRTQSEGGASGIHLSHEVSSDASRSGAFLPQQNARLAARSVCKGFKPSLAGDFKFKVAKTEHAEAIAHVVVAAFSKGDVFRQEGQRRTSAEDVAQDMQDPKYTWIVMKDKTTIVAAMLYKDGPEIEAEVSETAASVHMLSAHPDYWKQRLGVEFLKVAEQVAQNTGKTRLELSAANTSVRLIEYYKQLGFKERIDCDQEEPYFSPEDQVAYLKPEYQGYNPDGVAKLTNYYMAKDLTSPDN